MTGPQLQGQKQPGTLLQTLLLPDQGPQERAAVSPVLCQTPRRPTGWRHSPARFRVALPGVPLSPLQAKPALKACLCLLATPEKPLPSPSDHSGQETMTARRLWSRGRAPPGKGGEGAGLTPSGQVEGTRRQGQKTKRRSATFRKPWYRPHHCPLEGAQGYRYVPRGSRPPKHPRATRSPTASSAQSRPVDGPKHSPHAPCLSTEPPRPCPCLSKPP